MDAGKAESAALKCEICAPDRKLVYAAGSVLLDYPGHEVAASLDSVAADIERISCERARRTLGEVLLYLRSAPGIEAEETYTATFDFESACSLNLAWHLYGDTAERAAALAALNRTYREAGCEPAGDLPDYAPVMLEFLSACPDETALRLARSHAPAASKLAAALRERGSVYAGIAALVAECLEGEFA